MDYLERNTGLITGKNNLEELYSFPSFPIFMGCVDVSQEEDLKAEMTWDICRDTGFIQLRNPLPLDVLYLNQHNDGVGKIWEDHYSAFAIFLNKHKGHNILEIGGAHDKIASHCLDLDRDISWTIVEPHPDFVKDERIKILKTWFDDKFEINDKVDTVVHSHVFEHVYDPVKFIEQISNFLKKEGKHIFSFPNMLPMLKKNFTNCLNFEHTVFLTEYFVDYLLNKYGFKILAKEYYGNPHSIFYATEKVDNLGECEKIENKYVEYKKVFQDFINYHQQIVNELNNKIEETNGPIYLFGAHIFSQFLIQFGLKTDKIKYVLDNSLIKQGKRLYGTDLFVFSPKILSKEKQAVVILKAGIYNKEIKQDILENINNQIKFW